MASIEINGIDALARKLNSIERVNDVLERPMQRAVLRLQRDMADYPPQRAGSKYIRGYGFPGRPTSERLGQSWTTDVQRTGNGLTGKVGNNTSYGPFVQSKQFQARVHRGRWQTDVDVAQRNESTIRADFEATIQAELDK